MDLFSLFQRARVWDDQSPFRGCLGRLQNSEEVGRADDLRSFVDFNLKEAFVAANEVFGGALQDSLHERRGVFS